METPELDKEIEFLLHCEEIENKLTDAGKNRLAEFRSIKERLESQKELLRECFTAGIGYAYSENSTAGALGFIDEPDFEEWYESKFPEQLKEKTKEEEYRSTCQKCGSNNTRANNHNHLDKCLDCGCEYHDR